MRTSLKEHSPHLVDEWSEENYPLTPGKITYGSNKKVLWKGKCGHKWSASIKNRVNGAGCPYCSNNAVLKGMVLSAVMFFVTSDNKNLVAELSKTNWTALALGVAIVGLEFGYVCLYRAGWKISVGTLVANISLACVLLVVGILLYKEL